MNKTVLITWLVKGVFFFKTINVPNVQPVLYDAVLKSNRVIEACDIQLKSTQTFIVRQLDKLNHTIQALYFFFGNLCLVFIEL